MARYTLFLLIVPFLLAGCPSRPYVLHLSIYNDCNTPLVLHDPSNPSQDEKIENAGYHDNFYSLAQTNHLSADEYNKKIKDFLNHKKYSIIAKLSSGEEIYFTPQDILTKGEWPHPDIVNYYICKSRNATGGK